VGLKTAYLINGDSLLQPEYLEAVSKRFKAVSADVATRNNKLADVVFDHGYRLEHVFYSWPLSQDVPVPDLEQVLSAMLAVDFKGKLILSSGDAYQHDL
jgi:hypothetical protein